MKSWIKLTSAYLRDWRALYLGQHRHEELSPLRAEILSVDQLEAYGKTLAAQHTLSSSLHFDHLLKRLADNEEALNSTCALLTVAVKAKLRIAPAGEWLLDNFYLIEDQISTARQHLPKGYSRELPRLASGHSAGQPRVYDMALEIISHGDGRVDEESLRMFVMAYQTVTPLTLGELWAIPIMLRLALIENLRRVGVSISTARFYRNQAKEWADKMLAMAESDAKSLILVISDMARSNPPMTTSFVAELARLLQGHGSALAMPLTWIEQRLEETSQTIEQMVRTENQQQAAEQVSISNTIGSLRFLSALDWREFVESMSEVETILRTDSAGIYPLMNFATRDRYRHVIEKLAKVCALSEAEVARKAIHLSENAAEGSVLEQKAHVGYYLIGDGFAQFSRAVKKRKDTFVWTRIRFLQFSSFAYVGGIVSLTVLFSILPMIRFIGVDFVLWQQIVFAGVLLICVSQFAVVLVNWLATLLVKPQHLPRMDYKDGLPSAARTLVVIPTLVSSNRNVDDLLEALEVRYLGNQDVNLHFGLLTDFPDAVTQTLSTDEGLLQRVQLGIENLNKKYRDRFSPADSNARFFLLHRARLWNPVAMRWMGYERKRGKLAALNAVLRGGDLSDFSLVVGDIQALPTVKYVITLDTDTQLPRDSARQFVAAMAHPLNHPQYDHDKRIVSSGYGILQPRMAISLSGANRSRYVQLCSSDPGIDPYTRAISDVYEDVFEQGSFVGKGIYDVDAFAFALNGRLPENRILSHDLLEGCYLRSGLLNDVVLYEEYPAQFDQDVQRRERWIRGDWQIARWLLPWVPGLRKPLQRNPLSALSRWKILDNLRRSVLSAAMTLLLLLGWSATSFAWYSTLLITGILLLPIVFIAIVNLVLKPALVGFGSHLSMVLRTAKFGLLEAVFRVSILPYEASYSLKAITNSHVRLFFLRKRLLDWKESGDHSRQIKTGLLASYQRMLVAPGLAMLTLVVLAFIQPLALFAAMPILLLWLLAPALAWWLSLPLLAQVAELSAMQHLVLRKIARRTWAFFECYVNAENHWLPPDNYQEEPGPALAQRTSPTNIGMALLANLTACDFGFIPTGELLLRTSKTFDTLAQLERHQGHFLNWYSTETLQPLLPRYISSVDSGNLAGHLLTLRAALFDLSQQRISNVRTFEGLLDTLEVLNDECEALASANSAEEGEPVPFARPAALVALQTLLEAAIRQPPTTMVEQFQVLDALRVSALIMTVDFDAATENLNEQEYWTTQWVKQFQLACDELLWLCPWLALAASAQMPQGLEQLTSLSTSTTAAELGVLVASCLKELKSAAKNASPETQNSMLETLVPLLELTSSRVQERQSLSERLVLQSTVFSSQEYAFLYDKARHLMAIGYNIDDFRLDNSYYDLLASEARLCTFVGIAQGKMPQESWFALGRMLTASAGEAILVSWSGSMFEYLMPMLVMPSYAGSLLDNTCRIAVKRQIAYGKQRSLPWGVSESGYSTVDASLNYQYHAFGVPGLGLKRGLAEDSVVAPYASAMALMIAPQEAYSNLQRLKEEGCEGRFGFYEAVDYTPARMSRGQSRHIVRSYMSHHQGMSLLAIAHLLLQQPMQKRFIADPQFQATLLLLQEKIPRATILQSQISTHAQGSAFFDSPAAPVHLPIGSDTPTPVVQLLSNGHYHVMLTNAGGGYSHWNKLSVTRWREDSSCDNWGAFVYLRDVSSGEFWSTSHQPTLKQADSYAAVFPEGRAEFRRRDHAYESYSEIVVSPEDDIELRRVRITNRGNSRRTIELTSYAEVVLAAQAADLMQTAFSNLFVQTEIINEQLAILCTRRPRSEGEKTPWMFHLLGPNGTAISKVSFETDRLKFIGRGQTLAAPIALTTDKPLSASQGSVLDPIVSIRCCITLDAEQSGSVDFVTGIAESRDECLKLIEKYQDRHFADRAFDLTGSHCGVTLRQINANEVDALLYRRLASAVIYASKGLRAEPALLIQNRRGQSGLWGYAISGDLPIVLLKITDIGHLDLARQLIQCHAYWRLKGLAVDLVIWNEDKAGYRQQIQDEILGLIATGNESQAIDRPGGIFVRAAEHMPNEDKILLQAVARAIIIDFRGTLEEQVSRRPPVTMQAEYLSIARHRSSVVNQAASAPQQSLILSNPLGGFSEDGREYIINTTPTQLTPLPWVNVLANPQFGSVISESGLAYSWSENAHEYRLTPWSDDSVGAAGGEAIYLRDEQSGQFWSPTPLPSRGSNPYVTRHGFGYSVFEHSEFGIESTLSVFVDLDESVKYSVLKVRNVSKQSRHISATGYVEWVLGDLRSKSAAHIVTEIDADSGALFARNSYNSGFVGRVGFFDVDDLSRTLTADRTEFLGRNGSLAKPAAMSRARLTGRVGAALDPCGAIQVGFELQEGQEREIIFRLGAGQDLGHTRALVQRLRTQGTARSALRKVKQYWQQTLGVVQVQTPDPALNVMANGWLLYQTLACRLWARSGYYQSGGAFGFRDQLQDVMALVHSKPAIVRDQILRASSRQYPQGDVQHWWHPPEGRGVRTRCSDDFLWLPLVVCRYVRTTGDRSVLDERCYFLEGRALNADEESFYDLPTQSDEDASLYEHCVRSIIHGLRFGERGLPLMGSGDWNDGMNLVGIHGKGESVWLGFFLYKVLLEFAELASLHSDAEFAARCKEEASRLRANLDKHAWDGKWYRRAYFDDGTPLGSKDNTECVIDSISQSWSVLSGAGEKEKSQLAMNSLEERLLRNADGLVQLLDPPFDKSPLNPGYIKGYVPGVRENGGQYTHAAIWAAMAFAAQGDNARAWEVFALINPVNHSVDADAIHKYKAEPYVAAADVYAIAPHTGRAGWTWYTGSASWMYQLIVESILGLKREADFLRISPCMPPDWDNYSMSYQVGTTCYQIAVTRSGDEGTSGSIVLDGIEVGVKGISLLDDQQAHTVLVTIGTIKLPTN